MPLSGWFLLFIAWQGPEPSVPITLPDSFEYRLDQDASWRSLPMGANPPVGTAQTLWLRLPFEVHQPWREPRAISFRGVGQIRATLNGERFPRQEPPSRLQLFLLPDDLPIGSHVLEVTVQLGEDWRRGGFRYKFHHEVTTPQRKLTAWMRFVRRVSFHQMLLTGMFIAFSLLHIFLFSFDRRNREHAVFALLSGSYAVLCFAAFKPVLVVEAHALTTWLAMTGSTSLISLIFALVMMRGFFPTSKTVRRFHRVLMVLCAILVAGNLVAPFQIGDFGSWFPPLVMFEMARLVASAMLDGSIKDRQGNEWIIGVGSIPIFLTGAYHTLISLGLFDSMISLYTFPLIFYAMLVVLISISIYLAKNYTDTYQSLERHLVRNQELAEENLRGEVALAKSEAENQRKSEELEAARRLQLSLIPKKLPRIPGYQIAAKMVTATEVGGDYYDAYRAPDDSWWLLLGDATGHGNRAGTMVAAAKGAFLALRRHDSPAAFLSEASPAVHGVGFRGMFMALTALRLHDDHIVLSSAGMPPALLRRADGSISSFFAKSLPLGSHASFPYEDMAAELQTGDTLVLFSDGLEERFTPEDEMMGVDRVKELLASPRCAGDAASCLEALLDACDEWAQGRPTDDDITILVLRKGA